MASTCRDCKMPIDFTKVLDKNAKPGFRWVVFNAGCGNKHVCLATKAHIQARKIREADKRARRIKTEDDIRKDWL